MANNHGGLKVQNGEVADVALGTLGSRAVVTADGDFTAIKATFLIKRIRYFLQLEGVTADEGPFMLVLAPGNASTIEVANALTKRNTVGVHDVTQVLEEDAPWKGAYQSSIEMMKPVGGPAATTYVSSGEWISLGGGKGLPAIEDAGWLLAIFNGDNATLTTGAVLKGTYQIQGVWLGS